MTKRVSVMTGVFIINLAILAVIGGFDNSGVTRTAIVGLLSVVALLALGNPLVFTATLMALMLFTGGISKIALSIEPGRMTRSFFGVDTIGDTEDRTRILIHGTTVHGIQATGTPERERRATSYYAPPSGVGLAMSSAQSLFGPTARIDVVGLGAGTLACYARPGQSWRFYEIDPVIVSIAKTQFTFLSRCLPGVPIDIGDARLTLARRPTASTDVLVIDAFSSDSVPMHLLTLEAFAIYRRVLSDDGLLLVHISNRFLDLKPVLAAAAQNGWDARFRRHKPSSEEAALQYTPSLWVALSPSSRTMKKLVTSSPVKSWERLEPAAASSAWTDEHATILPIIKWRKDPS